MQTLESMKSDRSNKTTVDLPQADVQRAIRLRQISGFKRTDLLRIGFKQILDQLEAQYGITEA
jgi:hypothetical protein